MRGRRSRTAARSATWRPRARRRRSTPPPSRQRAYVRNAASCCVEPAPRRLLERAAHEESRGERVAGPGGIDDLGGHGGEVELRVVREHRAAARAPLEDADRRGEVRAAQQLPLRLGGEEDI